MSEPDDLTLRRTTRRLNAGEVHVSGVQLWDADTWILTVTDNETQEITTLRDVPSAQALPFVQALYDYANDASEGLWDDPNVS